MDKIVFFSFWKCLFVDLLFLFFVFFYSCNSWAALTWSRLKRLGRSWPVLYLPLAQNQPCHRVWLVFNIKLSPIVLIWDQSHKRELKINFMSVWKICVRIPRFPRIAILICLLLRERRPFVTDSPREMMRSARPGKMNWSNSIESTLKTY